MKSDCKLILYCRHFEEKALKEDLHVCVNKHKREKKWRISL